MPQIGFKSILVLLEESNILQSVLATSFLVAYDFEGYIEGLCLRPSLASVVATGFDSGVGALAGNEMQFEQE